MAQRDAHNPISVGDGMTRRELLRAGALSLAGASLMPAPAEAAQSPESEGKGNAKNCILIFLHGAPGQLDTWDMKPNAPREIRGPFHPIKTNVPGMEISEIFPRMARCADMYSIVRSMHHAESVFHDTISHEAGFQILRRGLLDALPQSWERADAAHPHAAAPHKELEKEPNGIRDKYGRNRFGQSCLLARRMVERGARVVTVSMFASEWNVASWDAHGSTPFPTLDVYRDVCGPWFDNGYTSLIEDLRVRGLYASTIVLATGEFGRTPHINAAGGRDHWHGCWSLLLGGGGLRGGQIVGASDAIGSYPTEHPVTPADLAATLHAVLNPRVSRPKLLSAASLPREPIAACPLHEMF